MAKLSFLWHLHQPQYRSTDGHVHAPWVLLHSAGEYLTLVQALRRTGGAGHVINLTPVFLEQLTAYRDGVAHDPLLEALATPARELTPAQRAEILRWAVLVSPPQQRRWPRLVELVSRAAGVPTSELGRRFTLQDLTDLQVLLVLAYAAPNAAEEPAVEELSRRGSGYGESARGQAVSWLAACPGRLLEAYRDLASGGVVEIATSPFAHPIMPLLIDTGVVAESWAPHQPPPAPAFAAPEDADAQLREGLELVRSLGFAPSGCWPPEGAVSEAALELYDRHGVSWLATDEGILSASLGRSLTTEHGADRELFRSWQLGRGGPRLFFRHRQLSDFIGFHAGRYTDETTAARDLADGLRRLARGLAPDDGIVIALDGENPWTSFPDGGARFLPALASAVEHAHELRPVTLGRRTEEEAPETLPRLHPGSWIGGVFATWIGHPEKNRGWELLAKVRALGGWRAGRPWLAAEGSDWWWWLGDDNPTTLAPLYDSLFRAHLRDACVAAGVTPPPELAGPIRSASVRLVVPRSREWPPPVVDGRTTNYFEWAVAAWVEAPGSYRRLARAALRADAGTLWLRVDWRSGAPPPGGVVVTLVEAGARTSLVLPRDLPGASAQDRCLEAGIPLPAGGFLMAVSLDDERLPAEGFWRIDLQEADEA